MIQDLDRMPADNLTQEQQNRAKRTITIKTEVDGQVFHEELDATDGFMLFIDKSDTAVMNRSTCSDLLIMKVLIGAREMADRIPLPSLLSLKDKVGLRIVGRDRK